MCDSAVEDGAVDTIIDMITEHFASNGFTLVDDAAPIGSVVEKVDFEFKIQPDDQYQIVHDDWGVEEQVKHLCEIVEKTTQKKIIFRLDISAVMENGQCHIGVSVHLY